MNTLQNKKQIGFLVFALLTLLLTSYPVYAQVDSTEDVTNSNFKLVTCDGPNNPTASNPQIPVFDDNGKQTGTRPYVVCDFGAAMKEVQHLINIMMVLGVVAALVGFSYAGYTYIVHGSEPTARSEASGIFKKVAIGFIIMLTAWFIVYQVLSWLECGAGSTNCQNSVGSALLGNP